MKGSGLNKVYRIQFVFCVVFLFFISVAHAQSDIDSAEESRTLSIGPTLLLDTLIGYCDDDVESKCVKSLIYSEKEMKIYEVVIDHKRYKHHQGDVFQIFLRQKNQQIEFKSYGLNHLFEELDFPVDSANAEYLSANKEHRQPSSTQISESLLSCPTSLVRITVYKKDQRYNKTLCLK